MSVVDDYEAVPEREPAWQVLDRAASYRKKLLAAGFLPLPVNGKAPPLPAWQAVRATPAVIDGWSSRYPDAVNTGILTLATPAVDIDVLDAAVADEVQAIAEHMIGVSAVRVGQAPRRNVPSPKGGQWSATQVISIRKRLAAIRRTRRDTQPRH